MRLSLHLICLRLTRRVTPGTAIGRLLTCQRTTHLPFEFVPPSLGKTMNFAGRHFKRSMNRTLTDWLPRSTTTGRNDTTSSACIVLWNATTNQSRRESSDDTTNDC